MLIEEIIKTNIGIEEEEHNIFLAKSLTKYEWLNFTKCFMERQINFACSYADIPRLDLDIVMHHLTVTPSAKLIKKKLRKVHLQVTLLVKVELENLLDVSFIRLVNYLEWISNIVPIDKLDGSIKICPDFRDINKACPKDDFLLPNIDLIIDLVLGHVMLSLMDGFFECN